MTGADDDGRTPVAIELPPLRTRKPIGVLIERTDLAGRLAYTVTMRDGLRSPRRRWFLDRDLAWSHAADQARCERIAIAQLGRGGARMSAVVALTSREPEFDSTGAEAAFLGAAMCENTIVAELRTPLSPDDFAIAVHGRIWAAILAAVERGEPATPPTLKKTFDSDPDLADLGGGGYLARLTANGEASLGVGPEGYAKQIVRLADQRRFIASLDRARALALDPDQPLEAIELPCFDRASPLVPLDLAALAANDPSPKIFILPRLAPAGEVTLFTGAGSVGKSLLAQQLATAAAAGIHTLGLAIGSVGAVYITCEDDAGELHWRQAHICKSLGADLAGLKGKLHLISLRGEPGIELATFTPTGRIVLGPNFARVRHLIIQTSARLVVLDNVAHLFGGNENDRSQVTAFVNALNRLAGDTGAAIILIGHPNKSGDSYSGSTAWLNAVRSQVVMARPDGDNDDVDPDARLLSVGKANYTRAGEAIRFRWRDWAFVGENDLPQDELALIDESIRASGDNRLFLSCLAERTRQHRAVSEKRSSTFAPAVFAKMPESKNIGPKRLEAAMDRLFRLGEIERAHVWNGTDRKPVFGLRETAGDGAGDGAGDTMRALRDTVGNPAEMRAGDAGNTHPPYTTYREGGALGVPPPSQDQEARP